MDNPSALITALVRLWPAESTITTARPAIIWSRTKATTFRSRSESIGAASTVLNSWTETSTVLLRSQVENVSRPSQSPTERNGYAQNSDSPFCLVPSSETIDSGRTLGSPSHHACRTASEIPLDLRHFGDREESEPRPGRPQVKRGLTASSHSRRLQGSAIVSADGVDTLPIPSKAGPYMFRRLRFQPRRDFFGALIRNIDLEFSS